MMLEDPTPLAPDTRRSNEFSEDSGSSVIVPRNTTRLVQFTTTVKPRIVSPETIYQETNNETIVIEPTEWPEERTLAVSKVFVHTQVSGEIREVPSSSTTFTPVREATKTEKKAKKRKKRDEIDDIFGL